MSKFTLSIDQGTTSTRSILFDQNFNIVASHQIEFEQIFPKDGCVEHNPEEIFETVLETARVAIKNASISVDQIDGIGIANQRETTVLWNKETGKPIYNAIV